MKGKIQRAEEAFSLVLFGATGDLARLKIYPAIYDLKRRGLLPKGFSLVGNGRSEYTNESFRAYVDEILRQRYREKLDEKVLGELLEKVFYYRGDITSAEFFQGLVGFFEDLTKSGVACGNRVFQLAILPGLYGQVAGHLAEAGLARDACGWSRLLIEKPFGEDLESARELDRQLLAAFSEEQIFRIDHYLAKETVQNILAFRFANEVFEPLWNREHVDHIQISVMEEFGMEGRGEFYERTGALRDMVQSHMLQVLAVTMMERPRELNGEAVRNNRRQVLESLSLFEDEKVGQLVSRGQYQGYREQPDTDDNSQTETFVALKAEVDNERWRGVPIYLRTGKKLARTVSEISVVYKDPGFTPSPNILTIRLAPNEGIVLRFFVKKPGPKLEMEQAAMQFCYRDINSDLMGAYEKVLLDVFAGERMSFVEAGGIEAQWKLVDPILKYWQRDESRVEIYQPGSWGPKGGDELIQKDERAWLEPSMDVCPI